MRHGDKIKNLGRTSAHRKALLSNLACQLIEYKHITTTLAKAKSLRVYVEPIITRSKQDTMHNRRMAFSYLQNKEAIKELFGVIGDKVASRPGGYTRIIKLQPRFGDAAEMAYIELVDFNETYIKDTQDAAARKTRRSRRGSAAKKVEMAATVSTEDTAVTTEETPMTTSAPEAVIAEAADTTTEENTPDTTTEDGTTEETK